MVAEIANGRPNRAVLRYWCGRLPAATMDAEYANQPRQIRSTSGWHWRGWRRIRCNCKVVSRDVLRDGGRTNCCVLSAKEKAEHSWERVEASAASLAGRARSGSQRVW